MYKFFHLSSINKCKMLEVYNRGKTLFSINDVGQMEKEQYVSAEVVSSDKMTLHPQKTFRAKGADFPRKEQPSQQKNEPDDQHNGHPAPFFLLRSQFSCVRLLPFPLVILHAGTPFVT